MHRYSLSHLSDASLLRDLAALVARDRANTAALLAHISEVDARRLYLPAGYPSMYAYCVGELGLSEDAAFKRIQAARAARRFPAIFEAVADGRIHLSGVGLLAPHLSPGTADELLAAASGKRKSEIERLLAERFPRPDVPVRIWEISSCPAPATPAQLAPGQVGNAVATQVGEATQPQLAPGQVGNAAATRGGEVAPAQLAPGQVGSAAAKQVGEVMQPQLAPGQVGNAAATQVGEVMQPQLAPGQVAGVSVPPGPAPALDARARMTPLSHRRYALQVTVDQETFDLLRRAQDLLGHELPAGDLAQVLTRALEALVANLEKRKFAATSRAREIPDASAAAASPAGRGAPGRGTGPGAWSPRGDAEPNPRHVPAHVRRAVWARDGGRCTFVSANGRRCEARARLEFDHELEVARGGLATISNLRLRCRAHNQHGAECAFGQPFMRKWRKGALLGQAVVNVPPSVASYRFAQDARRNSSDHG